MLVVVVVVVVVVTEQEWLVMSADTLANE